MSNIITSRVRQSSIIDLIFYERDLEILGIHFKTSNVTWIYFDVPRNVFGELISSSSIGSYFMRQIRNEYKAEKIEGTFYGTIKEKAQAK